MLLKKLPIIRLFSYPEGINPGPTPKSLPSGNRYINPAGQQWYLEVGQGMEKTQRIGNEKRAYVLTDRGTWLATKDQLEMEILWKETPFFLINTELWRSILKNILMLNMNRHEFIKWMISDKGQTAIDGFRDKLATPVCPQCKIADDMAFILESFHSALILIVRLDPELLSIMFLSLKVSGSALISATIVGLPMAALLGLTSMPLKGFFLNLMNTCMGLPPVVVGLFIYLMLSRSGPLGLWGCYILRRP
jgi:ABC-type sugar transport system permease subunit